MPEQLLDPHDVDPGFGGIGRELMPELVHGHFAAEQLGDEFADAVGTEMSGG